MKFTKTKSFGPRIRLTERQEEKLIADFNEGGLTCFVDQCSTGSVYVLIGTPKWHKNIIGEWYNDLYCGCESDIAKIRLSGHDEGRRNDATHNAVGSKGECMTALRDWAIKIIRDHGNNFDENNIPELISE